MAIDWAFISELEGGQALDAYVPAARESKSGATVATGIDIGQMTADGIDRLNIPTALKEKLKPYAGVTGEEAAAFLALRPLSITKEEADLLERIVKGQAVAGLKAAYDRAVSGTPDTSAFDALSDEAQTVLCSVGFQYGNLAQRAPKFWRACTEQRWRDARDELRNFGDKYPTRRKKEAERLSGGREVMTA
jgi:Bacterial toxin homologue of phage lysozyme, C-term